MLDGVSRTKGKPASTTAIPSGFGRRLGDRRDRVIQTLPDAFRRTPLVPRADDRDLANVGLRIGLGLSEGAQRLLDLLLVFDEMRAEAMKAEPHIDVERLLHRRPLRRSREVVRGSVRACCVGVGRT